MDGDAAGPSHKTRVASVDGRCASCDPSCPTFAKLASHQEGGESKENARLVERKLYPTNGVSVPTRRSADTVLVGEGDGGGDGGVDGGGVGEEECREIDVVKKTDHSFQVEDSEEDDLDDSRKSS